MVRWKNFLFVSVTLTVLCAGCASNEVASNSPDDINVAGSDVASSDGVVDTNGLKSELPPTTSAEAAPSAAPVSKINVSAAATTETNLSTAPRVKSVRVSRHFHKRKHHRRAVLVHHKHRRKHHHKSSLA
jgi:hypothetical protein